MDKILVFSDLHFFRGRLDYLQESCRWIADQIRRQPVDMVVFCGDLNHSHNNVETDTLHCMSQSMGEIAEATRVRTGKPLFAISGNHDTALKSTEKNIVEAISFLSPNITAITKPREVFGYAFAPYPPSGDKFDEYLSALHSLNASVIFGHLELADIAYSPASPQASDHPFPIPPQTKLVVNGHYHHPQRKKVAGVETVIVGSPCYHSYADAMVETPRGVLLLETDPSAKSISTTWVENPIGPIYHTIRTIQIPAVLQHPNVGRMRLRVKVQDQLDYEESKAGIMRLREVAGSVRVTALTNDAVAQIHKAETTAIDAADPLSVFRAYVAKKNLDTRFVNGGESLLLTAMGGK